MEAAISIEGDGEDRRSSISAGDAAQIEEDEAGVRAAAAPTVRILMRRTPRPAKLLRMQGRNPANCCLLSIHACIHACSAQTHTQCRICWNTEGEPPDGLLLSPCRCKGTSAHIHHGCLQRWLDTRPHGACDVCRSPYDLSLLSDLGIRIPPAQPLDAGNDLRLRHELAAARALWWHQFAAGGPPWQPPPQLQGRGGAGGLWPELWPRRRRRWWMREPGRDALFWSGLLHTGLRFVIAADGLLATLALLRHRRAPAAGLLPRVFGPREPAAVVAARAHRARQGRRRRRGRGTVLSTADEVRASFDGTTVWQVRWGRVRCLEPL
jgi:hypothetical protein